MRSIMFFAAILIGLPADVALVVYWHADVLGALAVGIRPLWLNRFGTTRPLAHVEEITSFEPLAEVLQKIVSASPE